MPDVSDLESMYGESYRAESGSDRIDHPKETEWVLSWLDARPAGTFLDYGCGSGELLVEARRRGWNVLGVELALSVVERARARTGFPVITVEEALRESGRADVLHLGDVLEHLTDLDSEMPKILSLLREGGVLLAQGPLEANDNLFTWILRLRRALTSPKPSDLPPYHVILATVDGQWALFHRFGLTALEQSVQEVSWPAPARLSRKDLFDARAVGLYGLRLASRALSRLRSDRWGNRYRYAGTWGKRSERETTRVVSP